MNLTSSPKQVSIPREVPEPGNQAASLSSLQEWVFHLKNCRLCKSITFLVFLLILAIESLILIPSAYNFRQNALLMLEQKVTATVRFALLADTPDTPHYVQQRLLKLESDPSILGLAVLRPDGAMLAHTGSTEFSDFVIDDVLRGNRDAVRRSTEWSTRYDIAWSEQAHGERLIFLANVDSSGVNAQLLAFVLRIAGLVAIIVAVVTAGTMLVLYRSILRPVLRLRRSMLGAAGHPDRAEDYRIAERPRDELGEVFAAHNEMLGRMGESRRADRLRAADQARFLARHDTLTGLPNRKFFLEHLQQTLLAACQNRDCVIVLVLNLSGFRLINDGFGQAAGDQVLIEIARRVAAQTGQRQFAARLGGDEFGIVRVGDIKPAAAAAHAEELLCGISRPVEVTGSEARLQGRIGIAYSGSDCPDAETVLHNAELALSRIRHDPQVRYQFFSPSMDGEARRRQEIEKDMRLALQEKRFQLFYQPKITLGATTPDHRLTACEALIRWPHPQWGYVPPAQFIPIAETTGLINSIGAWVLKEACGQIRRWLDAGLEPPRVAVNLSAQQFRDPKLPDLVRSAIAESAIEPGLLELEITESAAMDNVEQTVSILTGLRNLGLHLSIDDFGTGYSSLSYLRRFEVDSIKIDKSFVDDIGRDSNADAICNAIVGLGRSLGKRIVAEGVETEEQLAFLQTIGCEEIQGYLFGRPEPAMEFARRLARRD